jgi:beta-galactosidase
MKMRTVLNINENWKFSKTGNGSRPPGAVFGRWDRVNLPHTWNNMDGQDGGNDYFRGACWYKKEISISLKTDEQAFLEFQGANAIAEVFVNGSKAVRHEGGFSTFRADVTKYLKKGKATLLVRVDNAVNESVYPQTADFTFCGGIYRDVNLIIVNQTHFDLEISGTNGVFVTPKMNPDGSADVSIAARLQNADGCFVRYKINNETIECSADKPGAEFHIHDPHLWHGRKDPFLYELKAQLLKDGKTVDEAVVPFGIRSFKVASQKGFFLNGEPYPLRGVSRHQDWENMGWAITRKEHIADMELIEETGANAIRLAHYQHSPDFYDLCDRRGMIVWAEIPFISVFMTGEAAKQNTLSQMKELVLQNYNRPSIVCWGIANEITIGGMQDGLLDNLKELNDLCHELDQTRPTVLAALSMVENGSPHNFITDILGYNHYFGWYMGTVEENGPWIDKFHAEYPDTCLGISEYGCEGIVKYHNDDPQVQDYSEEYQAYYHEKLLETFASRPFLWSTFAWVMFDFASDMRDEGGMKGRNNKGLVTADRKIKKDSFYIYKAYWSVQPFVHICSSRFVERASETITVKVYSNLPTVALTVNGTEFASKLGNKIFIFENVPLIAGENKVEAKAGDCKDSVTFIKVDKPNADYELGNKRIGDGIANWFDGLEATETLEFPEGYYSIKDTLGDIMKNPEGEAFIGGMLEKATKETGFKINKGMLVMAKSFTVERCFDMAGGKVPEKVKLQINTRLNKIKK